MEVSRQYLQETYRELSDEELLSRVEAGTLTELAQEVAACELQLRGIPFPKAQAADEVNNEADDSGEIGADEAVNLVTVASFSNPLEANVLRACLESHGIFAYVWGEHLATTHRIFSAATSGARVQVPADQVTQAKEIIAAWKRGELEIEDDAE